MVAFDSNMRYNEHEDSKHAKGETERNRMPNIKERMITAVDCAIFRPKEFLDKNFFIAFTLTNLYKSHFRLYFGYDG